MDTTELKTRLQSNLQRGLERRMVDGALLDINLVDGSVEKYFPIEAHAMIVQLGDTYVMCSDLRRPDGSESTVDYYLAPQGKRFVIMRTEIDNRDPLKKLIRSGAAKVLK
ncbi:hypothetical protein [Actibacterium mucosum]|nr:hypothetical protein [Actibacterium mucosum]